MTTINHLSPWEATVTEAGKRFVMSLPVADDLADDPPALAAIEAECRGHLWADCVEQHGGRVLGPPELRHEPNPHYGMPLTDEDGEVVLNEAGEPVLDVTKFYIVASGFAVQR